MQKENRRQLLHLFVGLLIVVLVYFDLLTAFLLGIILLAGLILSFFSTFLKIPVLGWFLKNFDREKDLKHLPGKGIIFMFFGAFLAVFFFPKDIALASIIILALGDSLAPLLGQFGKIRHPFDKRKFLEGAIFGLIAGFFGALLFVNVYEALIASAVAMIVEGIDFGLDINPLDDNITIPIAACITITLLRLIV